MINCFTPSFVSIKTLHCFSVVLGEFDTHSCFGAHYCVLHQSLHFFFNLMPVFHELSDLSAILGQDLIGNN